MITALLIVIVVLLILVQRAQLQVCRNQVTTAKLLQGWMLAWNKAERNR